jgi:hypothetical protein
MVLFTGIISSFSMVAISLVVSAFLDTVFGLLHSRLGSLPAEKAIEGLNSKRLLQEKDVKFRNFPVFQFHRIAGFEKLGSLMFPGFFTFRGRSGGRYIKAGILKQYRHKKTGCVRITGKYA